MAKRRRLWFCLAELSRFGRKHRKLKPLAEHSPVHQLFSSSLFPSLSPFKMVQPKRCAFLPPGSVQRGRHLAWQFFGLFVLQLLLRLVNHQFTWTMTGSLKRKLDFQAPPCRFHINLGRVSPTRSHRLSVTHRRRRKASSARVTRFITCILKYSDRGELKHARFSEAVGSRQFGGSVFGEIRCQASLLCSGQCLRENPFAGGLDRSMCVGQRIPASKPPTGKRTLCDAKGTAIKMTNIQSASIGLRILSIFSGWR